jgi:two-component system nitrate/nitrite response regulator NarL
MNPIRIAIVEANDLFRHRFTKLLDRNHSVLKTASNIRELGGEIPPTAFDLIVFGISDRCPTANILALRQQFPFAAIVALSEHCDADEMQHALESGARGYLPKSLCLDVLGKSIELLVDDISIALTDMIRPARQPSDQIDPTRPQQAIQIKTGAEPSDGPGNSRIAGFELARQPPADRAPQPSLSGREEHVLKLLAKGLPNKLIAFQLGICEATVKVHVKAMLRKIGVRNRTQAAIWALDHHLVSTASDSGSS